MNFKIVVTLLISAFFNCISNAMIDANTLPPDESGYEAWLRYTDKTGVYPSSEYKPLLKVYTDAEGLLVNSALSEWSRAMTGFFGSESARADSIDRAGVLLVIDDALNNEGYEIVYDEKLIIKGGSERGLLYGTFACLQQLQKEIPLASIAKASAPFIAHRMLNHWDNMVMDPTHGSIERVYGGKTIFEWTDLSYPNPRYEDYARMLASIGINGVCLNNVNAEPEIIASETLDGIASLAAILRKWGVQTYLSVNFASPVFLGNLTTADPLEPAVQAWWKSKADEIYSKIPDFGGFIVKADSEGKPGPGSYGRTHVEGSRVLAQALKPHGGLIYWRAFVYGRDISNRTPHERAAKDRANHASYEFMHLDGQFEDNVILQIKCSAVDFQIWEPAHALFGLMPNTRLCIELDLPKEYKGYDIVMAWEGHYFHDVLNFETHWDESGATVAEIVAGRAQNNLPGGITAVSNINNSRNWFGHLFGGATLYTYGKQAWDPEEDPLDILNSYAQLTFGKEAAPTVVSMLDTSYDTMAKYMGLLGNHSQAELLHHLDADPWGGLFSKEAGITETGLGVDRTVDTGSAYLGLYHPKVAAQYSDPKTCPTEVFLFFHHVPWDYEMQNGKSVTQLLYDQYYEGVEEVREYIQQWRSLHGKIDLARWAHVYEKLALQEHHAEHWRDLMCRYFLEKSGIPDAKGRFSHRSPSPHNRVQTSFWRAVEDYRARVQREREKMNALIESNKSHH